jgi:hypothetical protein
MIETMKKHLGCGFMEPLLLQHEELLNGMDDKLKKLETRNMLLV